MSDKIYCDYDTVFWLDGGGYVVGACEETSIEDGCGWMVRAVNDAPTQISEIPIINFRQLQELNALHKTNWRTPEQVEEIRLRAEHVRRQYRSRLT